MISYKWKLKAIVQKSISILPGREKVNFFFQKNITKGVELSDEHFSNKIGHALDHINFYLKLEKTKTQQQEVFKNNLEILELGSGWYPVIPILFYLSNLGKVTSVDLQSWMNKNTIHRAFEKFIDWEKQGKLNLKEYHISPEKWEKFNEVFKNWEQYSYEEIKDFIGLTLMVGDARNLPLESQSFDFICSNNTFEHIYPNILKDILVEFKRLVKPNGSMCHFIDLSDHFAHFDHSINIYNFLKYSPGQWNIIDNSIQPQNRLRFKDYKKMYETLEIPFEEEKVRPGSIDQLKDIKVHNSYKDYSDEELAISHGYMISKMG